MVYRKRCAFRFSDRPEGSVKKWKWRWLVTATCLLPPHCSYTCRLILGLPLEANQAAGQAVALQIWLEAEMDSRISLLCFLVLASSVLHCARSDGKMAFCSFALAYFQWCCLLEQSGCSLRLSCCDSTCVGLYVGSDSFFFF